MNIHNQMQDVVVSLVTEIFSEEKGSKNRSFCTCGQCKLDVTCYVLNRVEPKYVVSERGVAHTEASYTEKIQETVDVVALIHEGIERVSALKRPYFPHGANDDFHPSVIAVYNFPMIKGRVFNGRNFEPVNEVDVFLRSESSLVEMVDPNWQNPCHIYKTGSGAFFFLPAPAEAQKSGEKKTFQFEVLVDDHRFEPMHHFFSLESVADERSRYALHTNESYSTEDLYLFPRE